MAAGRRVGDATSAMRAIAFALAVVAASARAAPLLLPSAHEDDSWLPSWLGHMSIESRQKISDVTGTASFIVWLFAQSPQLYENYRNSSCDGLSVVFLAQWMAGDVTNLVGSVLTGQLPFQIAIATYFCCIDACILAQYFYYYHRDRRLERGRGRTAKSIARPALSRSTSAARHHGLGTPLFASREMALSESMSSLASSAHSRPRESRHGHAKVSLSHRNLSAATRSSEQTHDAVSQSAHSAAQRPRLQSSNRSYRALEQAAMSVAELAHEAEVAALRREERKRRLYGRLLAEAEARRHQDEDASTSDLSEGEEGTQMHASLASLSSRRSSYEHGSTYGIASVPNLRFTNIDSSVRPPLSPSNSVSAQRGRDVNRKTTNMSSLQYRQDDREHNAAREARSSASGTRVLRRGASLSSRSNGLILLSVAAFFGLGRFQHGGPMEEMRVRQSKALGTTPMGSVVGIHDYAPKPLAQMKVSPERNNPTTHNVYYVKFEADKDGQKEPEGPERHDDPNDRDDPPFHPLPPQTWDKFIGRISAWTCALLYITSRMPQIWTNMQRRSVQGLSILLFIAAATGNLLYSISVLMNPKAHVPPSTVDKQYEYLLESLPFLLGSGGTLIFDAIIVVQWLAWRGKGPCKVNEGSENVSSFFSEYEADPASRSIAPSKHSRSASRPRQHPRWRVYDRQSLERQPLLE